MSVVPNPGTTVTHWEPSVSIYTEKRQKFRFVNINKTIYFLHFAKVMTDDHTRAPDLPIDKISACDNALD